MLEAPEAALEDASEETVDTTSVPVDGPVESEETVGETTTVIPDEDCRAVIVL